MKIILNFKDIFKNISKQYFSLHFLENFMSSFEDGRDLDDDDDDVGNILAGFDVLLNDIPKLAAGVSLNPSEL